MSIDGYKSTTFRTDYNTEVCIFSENHIAPPTVARNRYRSDISWPPRLEAQPPITTQGKQEWETENVLTSWEILQPELDI